LFNSIENLNLLLGLKPECFAFATPPMIHSVAPRTETLAVTPLRFPPSDMFRHLQQITRCPYFAELATAPLPAIKPYGQRALDNGGENVAVLSTINRNRSPTQQPRSHIDSGCFCIRMHVSLPWFG
jgi:hypothetical protein